MFGSARPATGGHRASIWNPLAWCRRPETLGLADGPVGQSRPLRVRLLQCQVGLVRRGCLDSELPTCPSAHLEMRSARVASRRVCWPRVGGPAIVGKGLAHVDPESAAFGRPKTGSRGWDDEESPASHSATRAGKAARRWTIPSSVGWHTTTKTSPRASTFRAPPASSGGAGRVDHDVGVETPRALRPPPARPSHWLWPWMPARPKRTGKPPGRWSTWAQTSSGARVRRGRGEEGGQTCGNGLAEAGGEVAPEGIGLDQQDLVTLGQAGGQGDSGRGDAG